MMGRKGSELIQRLANNIFYIVIIIFAIIVIMNVTSNMDIAYEYRLNNMEYNNYAARLLYSQDCLAYQGQYSTPEGLRYRVYPATVDVSKLDKRHIEHCLWGLDQHDDYELAIGELNEDNSVNWRYGSANSCTGKNMDFGLASFKIGWARAGSLLVHIRDGDVVSRGLMKFCYGGGK